MMDVELAPTESDLFSCFALQQHFSLFNDDAAEHKLAIWSKVRTTELMDRYLIKHEKL